MWTLKPNYDSQTRFYRTENWTKCPHFVDWKPWSSLCSKYKKTHTHTFLDRRIKQTDVNMYWNANIYHNTDRITNKKLGFVSESPPKADKSFSSCIRKLLRTHQWATLLHCSPCSLVNMGACTSNILLPQWLTIESTKCGLIRGWKYSPHFLLLVWKKHQRAAVWGNYWAFLQTKYLTCLLRITSSVRVNNRMSKGFKTNLVIFFFMGFVDISKLENISSFILNPSHNDNIT